jgi:hypothetical protein
MPQLHVRFPHTLEDMEDNAETNFVVTCPYCGEGVEIYLEPDLLGTLVQDCEVCCQPWRVHVGYDDGQRFVDVSRGDGSE